MPGKQSAPEVQLKVVQRNYDNISKLMHCKQQECDKLGVELDGARAQLQDAIGMQQQALIRASNAEDQIKLLERKLQDESQLQKTMQRANLEAAAAAQQQTALKQHVIHLSDKLELKTQESRRISKEYEGAVAVQDAGMQTLEALRVQYDALKALVGNTQAQLQSTKAQLQHAETASLQAQQHILEAESAGKHYQHNAETAQEQCRQLRQQCEEQKVTCSSLETALQARQAQDSLMASQLRAAQHLLQCEKLETQALSQQPRLRMQVLAYQSDVLCHKQQGKRVQEDNLRLQNQMLATGERLEKMSHDNSLDLKKEMLKLQRQLAGEEKRSSEDRARADLQCQQLQQQVHTLQSQLQGAQGQAAEAHRLRMDSCVLADRLLEQACQRLNALEPQLQCRISQAEKSVHAVLEEASQSCNQWTQLSESVEQRVTGLHNSIEVLRVTALAERQKGEASKPALVVLERTLADLQAQLAGEKTSHQLTQEAMARQAPTYAAHIAQIRQQAVEETAGERGRLQGQLSRVQAEMQRLQSCNDADRQATKDLMEVEKIQFTRQLERAQIAQLQLKQELASQQVQSQLRIAQVGETAHRDIVQLTQSRDMLTAVCSHLAQDVRQALEAAEGIADDIIALEDHLKKVGALDALYGPAPTAGTNKPQTDGDRADSLVKLMSHVRLHLLFLAEKLQEQLVAPEDQIASADSISQTKSQGPSQVQALTLSQQEKELRATVSKLVHAEQAQEALYTCMACVSLLKNPVVCTPCGHTFCYGCLMKAKTGGELVCPECNNLPVSGFVENRSLEGLVTKYEYRMGALKSLQRILK